MGEARRRRLRGIGPRAQDPRELEELEALAREIFTPDEIALTPAVCADLIGRGIVTREALQSMQRAGATGYRPTTGGFTWPVAFDMDVA